MNCNLCNKTIKVEGLVESVCFRCQAKLIKQLSDLPKLQAEASEYLAPGRGGNGSVSAERSIGINVAALDFSMATELIAILHGWEILIREGRRLTPPALLPSLPTTEDEVKATCKFHLAHLAWTLAQPWAPDFAIEVAAVYAKGIAACKQFVEQPRRIPCPSDDCLKMIVIDAHRIHENGIEEEVTCFGCKQSWSILRLVSLALNNPTKKFYLDIEAISLWLQLSERQVRNIIKSGKIQRQGNLYNLADVIKAR